MTVGGLSFRTTVSKLSYDSKKSAWAEHQSVEEQSEMEVQAGGTAVESAKLTPKPTEAVSNNQGEAIPEEKANTKPPEESVGKNEATNSVGGSEWTLNGTANDKNPCSKLQ